MAAPAWGVLFLLFALAASVALGVGTAGLLYGMTKKRWVWYLTPLYMLPWLVVGMLFLALLGFGVQKIVPAPPVGPVAPPVIVPEDTAADAP